MLYVNLTEILITELKHVYQINLYIINTIYIFLKILWNLKFKKKLSTLYNL